MNSPSPAKVCTTCGVGYPRDSLFCPKDGTPLTSSKGMVAPSPKPPNPKGPDAEVDGGNPADGRDSQPEDPYLGRELLDHIEIRQLAGAGAMGRVYRAFQKGIDRDVAVKILHRELSANTQLVARFTREAKVASRLQHANVVQVYLSGQLPDGALYIVMEYLDGLSLQSALAAAGGSMALVRALRIALQLCDATGEAHAQGIVHRDLKPENVMLVRRGEDADSVKVLDFGVARLAWGEQSMATAAGLIFGTARYISPEGAQGETVGPAGDVYAIATLVYQMLSGTTPFDAEQAVALLVQQIHDVPPPLLSHARASYVPPLIAEAVMKNLAKDPTLRDPDARAFGRSLLDAAVRSGLVESELVGRSSFAGARPAGGLQLASLQRTAGLQPEQAAAAMASGLANANANAHANAKQAGAARASNPGETQKWAPEDAPRITPTPPLGRPALGSSPSIPAAPTSQPRAIDDTMDDEPAPHAGRPALAKAIAAPTPTPTIVETPLPGHHHAAGRGDSHTELAESLAPPLAEGRRSVPTVPTSMPIQTKRSRARDDHPDDEEDEPRATRTRTWGLVLLCFLGGIALFAALAVKLHLLGPSSKDGTLDDQLSRARAALRLKHWDAPVSDNVRDLTTEGLSKWPREPRLLEIRATATDEIALDAVRHELSGDGAEALHLARLARELDPTDTTAQHLVDKYEAELAAHANAVPSASALPSLGPLDAGTTKAANVRVTLDIVPAKPRLGQTVSFVARVSKSKAVDDPHFDLLIEGQPTRLPAEAGGAGIYRGSFTFVEAGRYEVTFSGKVDGGSVHAMRGVTTAASPTPGTDPTTAPTDTTAPTGTPPDPTPTPSTTASPSATVKWL